MKKASKFAIVTLIIFLLILTVSVVAMRPLYLKIENILNNATEKIINTISEKTGLNVSYESFSPSILSSLKIKKISVKNNESQNVASIKSIKVSYHLKQLLKGNIDDVITNIVIDGIEIDVSKMLDVISEMDFEENEREETDFEIQTIFNYIPPKTVIKNIHFIFDNESIWADAFIKQIQLKNSELKNFLEINFSTKLNCRLKSMDMPISAVLEANGTLYNNLDNSFINLSLSGVNNGDYKLCKINLLTTYKDNKIEAHTIQSTVPLFLGAEVDLKTMDVKAKVQTENLNLLSVVTEMNGKNSLSILNNLRLSINADANINPTSGRIGYSSDGFVYIGEKLFPGSANVRYQLSGNDKRIKLSSLGVGGKNISLSGNLDFTFQSLQLGGFLDLKEYILPTNKKVATQIYIDPLPRGFHLFAPQVVIENKSLTALEVSLIPTKDSFDFDFEVSDYTSPNGDPGSIKIDGSFITSSNYAQANVTFNTMSISSIVEFVQQLVDENTEDSLTGIIEFTKPYVFSGDVYVSSDFKSISYNVPYIILANTEVDDQYVFASVNGNEQSLQIDRFDLLFGKYALGLEGSFDLNPKTGDGYFIADLTFSGIPYHLSGSIMQNLISISGDYGINGEVRIGKKGEIDASIFIDSLPIVVDKINLLLSLDASFEMDEENGPVVNLPRLEIKNNVKGTVDEPKILLSGRGSKYGAVIESIAYTDEISALFGSGNASYSFDDGKIQNASVSIDIKNQLSDEEISLSAILSNPNNVEFSSSKLLDSLYIDTNIDIKQFSLNRFLQVKNEDNQISATISVTGTLANPYGVINLKNASVLFGNDLLTAKGSLLLEDKILSIDKFGVYYGGIEFRDFSGSLSIENFAGKFNAIVSSADGGSNFFIPISLRLFDSYIPEGSFIPESFMVAISSEGIKGNLIKKKVPFEITVAYSKELISVFSSDNLGLVGTFIPSTGDLYGSINSIDLLTMNIDGQFGSNGVNLKLSNINANISKLLSYLELNDAFVMEKGILTGNFTLSGSFDNPDFRGALSVNNPKIYVPSVFPDVLSTDKIMISAANNEISIREDVYHMKKEPCFTLGAKIYLDKWKMDSIDAKFKTLKDKFIPLKLKTPFVNISGKIGADLLINLTDFTWDISGTVFGDNIDVISNLSDITAAATKKKPVVEEKKETPPKSKVCLRTDLNVILGTHVMLNFNPFMRCIFEPNTRIGINIDTEANIVDIQGGLGIKSGDISYLNRSFYIKEGNIKFNSNDLANPLINLRAETKDKDSKGKRVTIILSAVNQYLQDFNPKFSSVPSKSEIEIMEMLGNILVADAENVSDLLISGADYAFQSTVIRGVENKLRDLTNFDIFSIRTNVVQNALEMGTSGNLTKDDISIGNFLDNSTVYMGKYLGSNLYVDATLAFSLENGGVANPTKTNGLLFQPEFGLELELPIANIRWNMAPDIQAMMAGQYVPANSISLSWSFQF